ncbi:hypothetical protein [Nonomuraea dietziae]|uniref:hypothetical protein n=1 Tax=Nonomuraea dietziae TaxID=65515 RepID=UPI0031CF8EB0
MASESNTYQIKAADKCEALDVSAGGASAEQIKGWLNDTNAPAIVRAADAYASAASMVGLARESLLSAAKALSEMWGGPTAALFQAGLHKLDTTGDELATKMKRVSDQLNAYGAVHLPEAIRKVDAATAPRHAAAERRAQTHGHHHPDRSSQQQRSDNGAQHHSGPWADHAPSARRGPERCGQGEAERAGAADPGRSQHGDRRALQSAADRRLLRSGDPLPAQCGRWIPADQLLVP